MGPMKTVKIRTGKNELLNQKKLRDTLFEIFSTSWLGDNFKVNVPTPKRSKTMVSIDIAFMRGDQKIAVEYDGHMHYVNTRKCLGDKRKKTALEALGFKVICFPFYMELDNESFFYYFGEKVNIINEHPKPLDHGFVGTEWLPIDFCPLGIERFKNEYVSFPESIKVPIRISLHKEADEWGMGNVIPEDLWPVI
jgi:very-short-patch-repair endonuclease